MARVRIAVIGVGAIGRAHAEMIAQSERCELAAIADPTEQGRNLAQRLGAPWFPDHRSVLDAGRTEAAIIATPNATHLAIARDFIEQKIPVIVEKPIASTIEDARALTEVSEIARVPVLIGHHRRHNPITRKARQLIADGQLGRLTTATVLYTFFKPPDYFDLEWRRRAGGGPILINLIHEIDLIRFVCGEIVAVQAVTSNAVRGFEVEDTTAVILRLVGGALVTMSLSDTVSAPWSWDLVSRESANYPPQPAAVNTHFICGTEGSLTLPQLEQWTYRGKKGWFDPISRDQLAVDRRDPYGEQLDHLCRIVRDGETPLVSAADGTRTLSATLAVHEAARTGHMVNLPTDYRDAKFSAQ